MNTILIMIASTAIFFIGIQVGHNMKEDQKPITIPKVKEIKKNIPFTKEHKAEQKDKEEITRLNTILNNIDNFNGKKEGQVEVE